MNRLLGWTTALLWWALSWSMAHELDVLRDPGGVQLWMLLSLLGIVIVGWVFSQPERAR